MKFTVLGMLHETAALELAYGLRAGAARHEAWPDRRQAEPELVVVRLAGPTEKPFQKP